MAPADEAEPTTADDARPTAAEEPDRFASMGEEIASLMRTAAEAADRLTAGAEQDAADREAESKERAKATLAEATDLLEQARVRDREIRAEADAYAESRRHEHQGRMAEATELIAGLRRVLADAEQELGERIDQATQSLSKLTAMQQSLSGLEGQHAQLQAAEAEAESTTTGDGDGVIDLTDSDGSDESATEGAEAGPATEGTDDADGVKSGVGASTSGVAASGASAAGASASGADEQLDRDLRDARDRVDESATADPES